MLHMQSQGFKPPPGLEDTVMGEPHWWTVSQDGYAPSHGDEQPSKLQKGDGFDNVSISSSFGVEPTSAGSTSFESSSGDEDIAEGEPNSQSLPTTIMMRNIPNNMTRTMLLDLVNAEGFVGSYDFLYLPVDFKSRVGLGYSFINFIDAEVASRFFQHFSGFCHWGLRSDKVCEVTWSESIQGRDAHVERYMNSPVMHESIADECKPVLFKDGERMPFPAPTKRIRAPRQFPKKC
jgi:hypothetical protein